MSEIIIKDPKIIDFYSHNKHLDIEYINLALIDFYQKFIVNQEDMPFNESGIVCPPFSLYKKILFVPIHFCARFPISS